jgi:hypothetical protein
VNRDVCLFELIVWQCSHEHENSCLKCNLIIYSGKLKTNIFNLGLSMAENCTTHGKNSSVRIPK